MPILVKHSQSCPRNRSRTGREVALGNDPHAVLAGCGRNANPGFVVPYLFFTLLRLRFRLPTIPCSTRRTCISANTHYTTQQLDASSNSQSAQPIRLWSRGESRRARGLCSRPSTSSRSSISRRASNSVFRTSFAYTRRSLLRTWSLFRGGFFSKFFFCALGSRCLTRRTTGGTVCIARSLEHG